MPNKTLRVGGLFSGIGGIELGFQKAGFDILWANEIDKHCALTYRLNFSHHLYHQDVSTLSGKDLEPVDVLCAGFPCQAFSVAGYRKGFDDERGNLFFRIIDRINEMREKPRVLFLENVKNFRTHDNKRTYERVYKILHDENNYSVSTAVLNTCEYTEIPQNRERTFMICFRDEKNWEFEPKRENFISWKFASLFPPQKATNKKPITDYLEKKVDEKYYYREDKYMYDKLLESMKSEETLYQWRRQYVRENKNKLCPTLTANMGTGGHNVPLLKTKDGFRKLTPRECFNFQGFPKSFKLPEELPDSQLYKQSGNAVTVKLIKVLAESIKKALT
tara:strand:+ start:7198 stop:8196 length:999 start_codon:yes stop_codon:yes gene_type:complete